VGKEKIIAFGHNINIINLPYCFIDRD